MINTIKKIKNLKKNSLFKTKQTIKKNGKIFMNKNYLLTRADKVKSEILWSEHSSRGKLSTLVNTDVFLSE